MLEVARRLCLCRKTMEYVTFGIRSKVRINTSTSFQARLLSTNTIFGKSSLTDALTSVPDAPPLTPKLSLEEMMASGQSVLEELGLWSPFKPSSYFRWALESIHYYADIPWWGTIVVATCILRFSLIYVPIMTQRRAAIQSRYHKEIKEFTERMADAREEGNNILCQQVLMEQNDFLRKKGIFQMRQFMVMGVNGIVFLTQFFALKRMTEVGMPGISTEGVLWFTDLSACDPYYVLPTLSAITLCLALKTGLEFGSSPTLNPIMRLVMIYGIPFSVVTFGSQFQAALALYWVTNNSITLFYSLLFKSKIGMKLFNIPETVKIETKASDDITEAIKAFKRKKNMRAPPSFYDLKKRDVEQFKRAGRSKPITDVLEK